MIRTYTALKRFDTLEDRFSYLMLRGEVGESTFGFDRHMNQAFYRSREWKQIREAVIARDNGCDLGVPGYEVHSRILVHHMNPMLPRQIVSGDSAILALDYLITTTHNTHNSIHYGDDSRIPRILEPRRQGDTKLW